MAQGSSGSTTTMGAVPRYPGQQEYHCCVKQDKAIVALTARLQSIDGLQRLRDAGLLNEEG